MAIDNIDQSTSSPTAKSSFHGTAIFITQHPEEDNLGSPQKPTLMESSDSLQLKPLPDYYTVIPDVSLLSKLILASLIFHLLHLLWESVVMIFCLKKNG